MMNFYRVYIPQYSTLALPLSELTKKSVSNKITFNDVQLKAFLLLKQKLCECTMLYAVDFSKPFHLFCDASDFALGVALTQLADDEKSYHPVGFASCKFSDTQSRWSVIERESYSIVYGLRKYEHIVFGYHVICWSDHNPLSYLFAAASLSPKLTRWILALSKFDLEIRHISGSSNVVADFLSRVCL